MLSLQNPSQDSRLLHPNILPCSISHNGPIDIKRQYWNPQQSSTTPTHPIHNDDSVAESQQQHQQQQHQEQGNGGKAEEVYISYFRGRKLLGRKLELPKGYRGVIVEGVKQPQGKQEQQQQEQQEEERNGARAVFDRERGHHASEEISEDEDEDEDVVVEILSSDGDGAEGFEGQGVEEIGLEGLNQVARFEEITVWEHDRLPEMGEPFTRGVEEWLGFAGVVHGGVEE